MFQEIAIASGSFIGKSRFPVIEQSGRCQLEINDGILGGVTLSQTREHLGIIILITCFVGDYLYLQLRTTTIPCSLCWPLFSGFTKMIQKNPSEPDKKSSSHAGLSTSSFTNTHGLLTWLCACKKGWVKLQWMEEIQITSWTLKKQLQIVG